MGFGQYGPGVDGGQNTFDEAFPGAIIEKNLVVGHGEGRAEHAAKAKKKFPRPVSFSRRSMSAAARGTTPVGGAVTRSLKSAGGDYRLSRGPAVPRGRAATARPSAQTWSGLDAAVKKAK